MSENGPQAAVDAVQGALQSALGDQLQGLLLFGSLAEGDFHSGRSDVNLLAVIDDGASLADVRAAFLPVWTAHGALLQAAPMLLPARRVARHVILNPTLAHHVHVSGRALSGPPAVTASVGSAVAPDEREWLAVLAHALMSLSAIVAPELLDDESLPARAQRLKRTYQRVMRTAVDAAVGPIDSLAELQAYLHARLETALPEMGKLSPPPDPPDLLPDLQAIYERGDELIVVLPEPLEPRLRETDWSLVAERLAGDYYALQVTTPEQLRLAIEFAMPLDITLMRLNHVWGNDILQEVDISRRRIFTGAARQPHLIQIDELAHAYLTVPDEKLGRLIHDYQNKLHNILLQDSLLGRMAHKEGVRPPALPDREAPQSVRIRAIFDQFDWWSEHYYALLVADGA